MAKILTELTSNTNLVYGTNKYLFNNRQFYFDNSVEDYGFAFFETYFFSKKKEILYKFEVNFQILDEYDFENIYKNAYNKLSSKDKYKAEKIYQEFINEEKDIFLCSVNFSTKKKYSKKFSYYKKYERKPSLADLKYEFGGIQFLIELSINYFANEIAEDDYLILNYIPSENEDFRNSEENKRESLYRKMFDTYDKSKLPKNFIGVMVFNDLNFILNRI